MEEQEPLKDDIHFVLRNFPEGSVSFLSQPAVDRSLPSPQNANIGSGQGSGAITRHKEWIVIYNRRDMEENCILANDRGTDFQDQHKLLGCFVSMH